MFKLKNLILFNARGFAGLTALLLAATIAYIASLYFGLRQYPGYDASPMVNEAYRIYLGQKANIDFFSPFPPLFSWVSSFAIELLGPYWYSFSVVGAIFATLASVIIFQELRKPIGSLLSFFVAIYAFVATGLFVGFWWHGTTTTLVTVIFFSVLANYPQERSNIYFHVKVLVIGAMLFLLKPNIALPALLCGYLWLALPNKLGGFGSVRISFLQIGLTALTAFLFCKYLINLDPVSYIQNVIEISKIRSDSIKILEPTPIRQYLLNVSIIDFLLILGPLVIVLMNRGFRNYFLTQQDFCKKKEKSRSFIFIAFASVISGVAGIITNGDFPITSYPLIIFGFALIIARDFDISMPTRPLLMIIFGLWLVAIVHAAQMGFFRDRVLGAGYKQFWEEPIFLSRINEGFFKNAEIGPTLIQFMEESKSIIEKYKPKKVFFGPRVEFGYAAFALDPAKNIPLWFDPTAAWLPSESSDLAMKWINSDFEMLIFHRMDVTYMPNEIIEFINKNYRFVSGDEFFKEAGVWIKNFQN